MINEEPRWQEVGFSIFYSLSGGVIFNPQHDTGHDSGRPTSIGPAHPGQPQLRQVRALVLNSSYQPVKLVSWQRALLLWFQGKVEVLEYHSTVARSAREDYPVPSVLRLKRFINNRRFTRVKFCRENVYRRDAYMCQYCGDEFNTKELTLDHVVPASKKGRKDWTNMVTACRKCNHRKANRTPLAAGMPLLSEPKVPSWLPPIRTALKIETLPESWRVYLASLDENFLDEMTQELEDLTG